MVGSWAAFPRWRVGQHLVSMSTPSEDIDVTVRPPPQAGRSPNFSCHPGYGLLVYAGHIRLIHVGSCYIFFSD
ncbi:hypothetical protein VTO42DRAFT_3753 [Malbranchea cinnamomea]